LNDLEKCVVVTTRDISLNHVRSFSLFFKNWSANRCKQESGVRSQESGGRRRKKEEEGGRRRKKEEEGVTVLVREEANHPVVIKL
jgi:hypothetical protein